MTKNHLPLLVLASAVLGILVWFDNRPDKGAEEPRPLANSSGDSQLAKVKASAQSPTPSNAPNARDSDLPTSANPLAELDRKRLRDTIARPLFAQSRRPPQVVRLAPSPIIEKKKLKPVAYKLLGVADAGDRAIALLGRESDGRNFRVEVGDMLSGWSVSSITKESVLLERKDGSAITVYLFKDSAAPP